MAECRICGQPVHRYSPDHPSTPDDLMGCVNSLRGALEEVEAERDRLCAERMSNITVGGERLTWQEAAEHHQERAQHEGRLAGVLADLDRCEHGRHKGDTCGSCGGPSHGNPHLQPVMGYDLSATPIVMPDNPRERRNPDAWYARTTLNRDHP